MSVKVVCTNRKAHHDYFIDETIEAGIALLGSEVKALREGRANLTDSYVHIRDGQAYLVGCHISPYSHGGAFNHEALRERKLLLHKKEILRLHGKIKEKGFALIGLKIYFSKGRAKIALGLARGKKLYDKREAIKKRADDRDIERVMKTRSK